ncbi:MAG: acyltransferase [Acidobacteriia bacterium]|nr:acyltransferase [Terriglobia bacterium]
MKRNLKLALQGISLLAAWLPAAAAGFGRWKGPYTFFAHAYALVPGIPGDYLRVAFYRLTLDECALSSRISFGSFFAHPGATLGPRAYVGSYCIIGRASIGGRVQIASGVQVLSGSRQHVRDEEGRISGAEDGVFSPVTIGDDCWIGAAAVVMADVGAGSTIGAGSVVVRPIPSRSVAVGSPARVVSQAAEYVTEP